MGKLLGENVKGLIILIPEKENYSEDDFESRMVYMNRLLRLGDLLGSGLLLHQLLRLVDLLGSGLLLHRLLRLGDLLGSGLLLLHQLLRLVDLLGLGLLLHQVLRLVDLLGSGLLLLRGGSRVLLVSMVRVHDLASNPKSKRSSDFALCVCFLYVGAFKNYLNVLVKVN